MSETKWTIKQPGGGDEPYEVWSAPDGGYLVAGNLPIEDARQIAASPALYEALEKIIQAADSEAHS